MTTNRMGLEQSTLSDERLELLITSLIMSTAVAQQTQSFAPSFATQNELQVAALRELLAYRKESKELVKVNIDMAMAFHHALSDGGIGGDDLEEIMIGLRAALANYAGPPIQAVTVPDAIEPDYDVIKGILPTSNPDEYACCIAADMWNACRAAMLKSVTNEP